MPLSQHALRFAANNTENRYELGICVDQLGDCHGVVPKVALPIDWVREALRSGIAKASFAARYCDDEAALSALVTRERRVRVQQALASNLYLSNANFRALVASVRAAGENRAGGVARNNVTYTIRELERLRKQAVKKRGEALRRRAPAVVQVATLDALLANRRTYTTKSVSSVLLALRAQAGEAFAVDNLLRGEAAAGATRFALAYLKNFYIAPTAHSDVWARCVLSPAEVVSLHTRANRVALLSSFMAALIPVTRPPRPLDVDIVTLVMENVPVGRLPRRGSYRSAEKFTPAAIDLLLNDWHWVKLLWDHELTDQQFGVVAGLSGHIGRDLVLNLMGDDPGRLAKVLVAAWNGLTEGNVIFHKAEIVTLERKFAKVPVAMRQELLDNTEGLAYLLMNNALFSEYIYQRLASSGLSTLAVVEGFEDNKDLSLSKFLDDIAALEAIV